MNVKHRTAPIDKSIDKREPSWKSALIDLQREILASDLKLRRLRSSEKIIRQKIASGEPWPGEYPVAEATQ